MTGPEDNYVTDGVGVDGLVRVAEQAHTFTGRPQRIHVHAAGERCRAGCWEIR